MSRVPIKIKVNGKTSSLSATVGEHVGSAIIFANSNPITGLDQMGKVYYEDQPNRTLNPRQAIREADRGKTFVVEASPFPLGCNLQDVLAVGETGIPYEFVITSQPDGGKPTAVSVKVDDADVDVNLEALDDQNSKVSFTPLSDGGHTVTVTFTVTTTLNVAVGAMEPDPLQCVAYGPGLEGGEQYKEGQFTIEARNKLGDKIPFGGHAFKAKVTDPFNQVEECDIVDNGDGTYTASYTPILNGDHKVEVLLADDQIKDSPFTVPIDFASDAANADQSYAEGPGLEPDQNKTNQREPSTFTIHAVDKDGNPRTTGGDDFDVMIEDPLFDKLPANVTDNGDGTYTVEYEAKEPGLHNVDVVLRNKVKPMMYEHVKGSPVEVPIKAGTDPSKCTAEGPGLEDGIKDTFPAEFKIQARDRDGNPINEGGDPFEVKITDPDGKEVPVDVKDN